MDPSAHPTHPLATALQALTEALDDPDVDLTAELDLLHHHLATAVPSYLGLTITLAVGDQHITFSSAPADPTDPARPRAARAKRAGPAAAGTSLHILLAQVAAVADGSAIVLYAASPGAFVDLSADLAHALDVDLTTFQLDQHHDHLDGHDGHDRHNGYGIVAGGRDRAGVPSADGAAITGLHEVSVVSQAIGVLLERGYLTAAAYEYLHSKADSDGTDLASAAAAVIADAASSH